MKRAPEKILPPVDILRKRLHYERSTGKLFLKRRPLSDFRLAAWGRYWNRRWAGKEAGSISDSGHRTVGLFGKTYKAHRIIWKMVRGTEPPPITEHKNRKPDSNKDSNIRAASYSQNFINRTKSWGKHGYIGLRQSQCGNWEARIHKDRKYIHLGTFKSKRKAIAVRRKAAIELYGEFAP